jgi:hypothetical protein
MAIDGGYSVLNDAHPIKPYHNVLREKGYAPSSGQTRYEGSDERQNTYHNKQNPEKPLVTIFSHSEKGISGSTGGNKNFKTPAGLKRSLKD